MGEGTKPATLYFAREDGTGTPLPCGLGEFTLPDDYADSAEGFQPLEGYTLEVKSKHLRCHSRRRLVKLLMGQGRSRNESNRIARQCRERGIPYKREWFMRFFDGGAT